MCFLPPSFRKLHEVPVSLYVHSESRIVVSDSLQLRGLYSLWNSPGQNTGVRSHSLQQGIFPTQISNPGLPHCRQILHPLSHREALCAQPAANCGTAISSCTDLSWGLPALLWGCSEPQWTHQENWNLSGLLWG